MGAYTNMSFKRSIGLKTSTYINRLKSKDKYEQEKEKGYNLKENENR